MNDGLDFVIAGKFVALENVEAKVYFCWGDKFNKTVRVHGWMMDVCPLAVKFLDYWRHFRWWIGESGWRSWAKNIPI